MLLIKRALAYFAIRCPASGGVVMLLKHENPFWSQSDAPKDAIASSEPPCCSVQRSPPAHSHPEWNVNGYGGNTFTGNLLEILHTPAVSKQFEAIRPFVENFPWIFQAFVLTFREERIRYPFVYLVSIQTSLTRDPSAGAGCNLKARIQVWKAPEFNQSSRLCGKNVAD